MKLTFVLLAFAVGFAAALPVPLKISDAAWNKALGEPPKDHGKFDAQPNGFSYAIDMITKGTASTFSCLLKAGYKRGLFRIYGPDSNGKGDLTGISNILAANNVGFTSYAFLTPSTTGVKSGSTQFTEALNFATSQNIGFGLVFLQVTSPANWGTNTKKNVDFINSFISTATANGKKVGIYTNWYDWSQITGSTAAVSNSYSLWYWQANGFGVKGESAKDAKDFVSFGPFVSAQYKQFGISETICSTTVGVSLYNE